MACLSPKAWAAAIVTGLTVGSAGGCASVPDYLVDPIAHPHPTCSPAENFIALGTDPQSPEGAVTAARARAAGQVSSTLKSHQQVERTVTARSGDGEQTARIDKQLKTVVDERVEFAHAELLRTVGQPGRTSTGFVALVCLERAAAARAIRHDVGADVAVSSQALRNAREALGRSDYAGFVVAQNTALPRAERVRDGLQQVATLGEALNPDERELLEGLSWMAAAATRLRGEARLAVRVDASGASSTVAEVAPRLVLDAAAALGVTATLAADAHCAANPGSLFIDVRVVSACRRGSLGHTCSLSMPTTLSRCGAAAATSSVDLAGPTSGSDPREDLAAKRSTTIARAAVIRALQTLLASEVPLETP